MSFKFLNPLGSLFHMRLVFLIGMTLGLVCASISSLDSLPKGAQVLHGKVNYQTKGLKGKIYASNKSVIQFETFDVQKNESLRFIQPSKQSRVLNSVVGGSASQIQGQLLSNGQVYLINPSGIYFGSHSLVDVAGLYAVAGQMDPRDFLEKRDYFTHINQAVENRGTIRANYVHLLGKKVKNLGDIYVQKGWVSLVAADEVRFCHENGHFSIAMEKSSLKNDTDAYVEQGGNIQASDSQVFIGTSDLMYALSVRHLGKTEAEKIEINAGQGLAHVKGKIKAHSSSDKAPKILITGKEILLDQATLSAKAKKQQGEIHIGGRKEKASVTHNASQVTVGKNVIIDVSAQEKEDAGTVTLWADENMLFSGRVLARGGPKGGDGGFVEVSGKTLIYRGSVDARAAYGKSGTVYLDPEDIVIVPKGSDDEHLPILSFSLEESSDFTLSAEAIEDQLKQANVLIEAMGSIDLLSSVRSDQAKHSLSLKAKEDVRIGADLKLSGSLDVQAGDSLQVEGNIYAFSSVRLIADHDQNSQGSFILGGDFQILTHGNPLEIQGASISLQGLIQSEVASVTLQRTNAKPIAWGAGDLYPAFVTQSRLTLPGELKQKVALQRDISQQELEIKKRPQYELENTLFDSHTASVHIQRKGKKTKKKKSFWRYGDFEDFEKRLSLNGID